MALKCYSGPAIGVVAGTKIPNYCVMSETSHIAREIEKQGEGMRILISEASRRLIDKVGGFRCESRGLLEIKVQSETFLEHCNCIGILAQGTHGDVLACRT